MENTSEAKKGQIRQWKLAEDHPSNNKMFLIIAAPDETVPPEAFGQIAHSKRNFLGRYLKLGEHPEVVREAAAPFCTVDPEFLTAHSLLVQEVKSRPRTAGMAFDKFDLKVKLVPSRDVPKGVTHMELANSCKLACECPVSNALRHAVKPRFRRWKDIKVFTLVMNAELHFTDAKGKKHFYQAELVGGLNQARINFDRDKTVDPAEETLTFTKIETK